jgi:hypothetical protein
MIKVKLVFAKTEDGGRKGPIHPPVFSCIFTLDGRNFDCRLILLDDSPINPGEVVETGIQFLSPDLVLPEIKEGLLFTLREVRQIASGEVLQVE